MQANTFSFEHKRDATLNPEGQSYSFDACRDRLLIAIAKAEQDGFVETRIALIEALHVLIDEKQTVRH